VVCDVGGGGRERCPQAEKLHGSGGSRGERCARRRSQALRELVDNEDFRRNAGAIGENLRQEDSMTHALAFIEAQLAALRA
jgi:hypothetical protein